MKKIIAAILIVSLLFTLSACGSNPSKVEKQYIALAQESLEKEDFNKAKEIINEGLKSKPKSEFLQNMLQEIEEAEAAAIPPVPTIDEVKNRFIEFYDLVMKWYVSGNVSKSDKTPITYQHTFDNGNTDEVFGSIITEPGIGSVSDLENLFLSYCTEEAYKDIKTYGPPLGFYDDVQGNFCQSHIMGGYYGDYYFDKLSVKVTPLGEENFSISFLKTYIEEYAEVYSCSCMYSRDDSKQYKFGIITEKMVSEQYPEPKTYKTAAGGTSINLKEFPHEEAEAIISLNENQVVTVISKYDNWAYAVTEENNAGWIKFSKLSENSGSRSSGRSGGGNIVNDAVNAGIGIASGVLNSIF